MRARRESREAQRATAQEGSRLTHVQTKHGKQGRCVFCNGHGLSKEHVVPEWMHPIIGKTGAGYVQYSGDPRGELEERLVRDQDFFERKPRVVCKRCNSEWMSILQDKARPILVPLILGQSAVLTVADQATIASWVVMTAMVAERVDWEGLMLISPSERDEFRKTQHVPSNWRIWIGSYSGSGKWNRAFSRVFHAAALEIEEADAQNPCGQTIAFGLGNLFICSVGIYADAEITALRNMERVLRAIVPPRAQPLKWPNDRLVTDELAERFGKTAAGIIYTFRGGRLRSNPLLAPSILQESMQIEE